MISDKPGVQDLMHLLKTKGIEDVVISPGSRNAPLSISFQADKSFRCKAVMDERVAAFIALGISQHTQRPTVLVCTSGSALLNYYPAVAEAFYQNLPLIILSADRPTEWIDQADGQTIRQNGALDLHLRKSVILMQEVKAPPQRWHNQRLINEALNASTHPFKGPVHINFPFEEPLYGLTEHATSTAKNMLPVAPPSLLDAAELNQLAQVWNNARKRLILVGCLEKSSQLAGILDHLAALGQAVVMTETTSNISSPHFLPCLDRVINTLSNEEKATIKPDLLITVGTAIVSKKIKVLLRNHQAEHHWHVAPQQEHPDTYQQLTNSISIAADQFFEQLNPLLEPSEPNYFNHWKAIDQRKENKHDEFIETLKWSDFKVFDEIQKRVPTDTEIQLANSSPVRYAQLFNWDESLTFHANRGTSGIDGCTSTAVGQAMVNQKLTVALTGDVSFFYDSNAFYHHHLPPNLRVIVINNGGGGIFRIIPGPDSTDALEDFFETHHNFDVSGIASAFHVKYACAKNEVELSKQLDVLFSPTLEEAMILEIRTPRLENAEVLNEYFKHLSNDQ
mgnify:CR=1 FL=1